MKELFYVFVGGGTGSILRYLVSMFWAHLSLLPRFSNCTLPWPTLVANVCGCFLIGLFYQFSEKWGLSPETRLMLTTGFCGGFTTFSTFSTESLAMLRAGLYSTYFIYLILSILLGLVAVLLPSLFCSNS